MTKSRLTSGVPNGFAGWGQASTNTDINDLDALSTVAGLYRITVGTVGTKPPGFAGTGQVIHCYQSPTSLFQIAWGTNVDGVFYRRYDTGAWKTWRTLLDDSTNPALSPAPAPTVKSAAATLTTAELLTKLLQYTGASDALTLPLATAIDTALPNMGDDKGFDFSVINTGSGTATMTANTGVTIAGAAAVAAGSSSLWRLRRVAVSNYIAYRLA